MERAREEVFFFVGGGSDGSRDIFASSSEAQGAANTVTHRWRQLEPADGDQTRKNFFC
jgi:hypothetical protein